MIHLKKAKNDEFYWISVSKRANTFGETARSSETYGRRTGAAKGLASHATSMGINLLETTILIIDHTRKRLQALLYDAATKKIRPTDLGEDAIREAEWVVNNLD